ncbi:MAG: hypothetical protein IPN87_18855 [Saprospiraceae bacterium]|nr:hypothetical protein [Candidatus Brachybacter algidus]
MRNIKNSYFRALSKVTSTGKFPEYSDLWRCYHPTALMLDSDYCLFTNSDRLEPTTSEEARTGQSFQKRLYVPVTRKVSPLERKKAANLKCKVSLTDETKEQKDIRVSTVNESSLFTNS